MKGRIAPRKIKASEQPELPGEALIELERDRLYFLEHPECKLFNRPFVSGEGLPFKPGLAGATVDVYRYGARLIIVGDKPMLFIEGSA